MNAGTICDALGGRWHGSYVVVDRVLVGIHRTYLAEPGTKAFDEGAKLMRGRCAGGAVRLSDGPGALLVVEGIETGLSLLSGITDTHLRTWSALSTSGVAGLILSHIPGELVLAPDGDAPGRAVASQGAVSDV